MQTAGASKMTGQDNILSDLRALGVESGDIMMVHASLRAVGSVVGGPAAIAQALLDAVSPGGTLMALVSWEHSSYDATLNGRKLPRAEREAWPTFDPDSATPYPGYGALNRFLVRLPGAVRSAHPDASIVAIGDDAATIVSPHDLGSAYGPGSPLERLVSRKGKVLLLGAPLDAVTVLHYAEALADIPGKRKVRYEVPVSDSRDGKKWLAVEELDSNGILDDFVQPGAMDAVETMARAYVKLGRHQEGRVGTAQCFLFDAVDLVRFGVEFLEGRYRK